MNQYGVTINQFHEGGMTDALNQEYYDYSDFFNFGFWNDTTKSQKEACENLMEQLLAFIPTKTGTILDVACGKGATTRYLLKYYKPEKVTGINISEKQLEMCRKNVPGCKFLLMDAAKLDFKDASFDNIVCVEAAFHFNTRKKFFEEVYRVLKPGGKIAISDCLISLLVYRLGRTMPEENYIPNIEAYQSLLHKVGFAKVGIRDETQACWGGAFFNRGRFLKEKLQQREINLFLFKRLMSRLFFLHKNIFNYILVNAEKPRKVRYSVQRNL